MRTRRQVNRSIGLGRLRQRRQLSGFTLIELMIAMLLGLIVIAGVVSVFLANQRVYRTNQALGDVQDGSRISFEMMARDIRNAGLTGCGNGSNGRVANVLKNSPIGGGTAAWWGDWNNAVHGYLAAAAATDPQLTVGTSATNQVSSTDSLQLIGAADSGLSVASQTAGTFVLNETSPDMQAGDVVIVCDPDHAAIFQITGYTPSSKTITYATSGGTPGNCSTGLGYPTVCTATGTTYTYQANALLSELNFVDWYVGYNSIGGKSLYRVQSSGGTATPTAQEMVRDVTDMKIVYHQPPNASFVTATNITNWSVVDAAQVTLTVQSVDQAAGTDAKPISRTFTATSTVRNRVN